MTSFVKSPLFPMLLALAEQLLCKLTTWHPLFICVSPCYIIVIDSPTYSSKSTSLWELSFFVFLLLIVMCLGLRYGQNAHVLKVKVVSMYMTITGRKLFFTKRVFLNWKHSDVFIFLQITSQNDLSGSYPALVTVIVWHLKSVLLLLSVFPFGSFLILYIRQNRKWGKISPLPVNLTNVRTGSEGKSLQLGCRQQ